MYRGRNPAQSPRIPASTYNPVADASALTRTRRTRCNWQILDC